jgi:hypothetical protein
MALVLCSRQKAYCDQKLHEDLCLLCDRRASDLGGGFACFSKRKCGAKSELQISPGAVTRARAGQDENLMLRPMDVVGLATNKKRRQRSDLLKSQ